MDGSVFDARPTHMAAAFQIIVAASEAEHRVGSVLLSLSPYHAVQVAKFFNSLEGDSKKSTSIEAIAMLAMPEYLADRFRLCLKHLKTGLKLRNPFAHSRFGYSTDVPDLLLVIDTKYELLSMATKIHDDTFNGGVNVHAALDIGHRNIKAYTLAELVKIKETLDESKTNLSDLWNLISGNFGDDLSAQVLSELDRRLQR